jgi:hypothetical protein
MTPIAGWYEDPNEVTSERYWDGDAWTRFTRASTRVPVEESAPLVDLVFEAAPTKDAKGRPLHDPDHEDPAADASTAVVSDVSPDAPWPPQGASTPAMLDDGAPTPPPFDTAESPWHPLSFGPFPPPSPTAPRRRRTKLIVALGAAGVLIIGIGVGAALSLASKPSASAAVSSAAGTSLGKGSATYSMNLSISAPGMPGGANVDASGASNFTTNEERLNETTTINGEIVSDTQVIDGEHLLLEPAHLSKLIPGKSWLAATFDQVEKEEAGELKGQSAGAGIELDAIALLHVLSSPANPASSLGPSTIGPSAVSGYTVHLTQARLNADLSSAPRWMHQIMDQLQIPPGGATYQVYVDKSGLVRQLSVTLDESLGSGAPVATVLANLDFTHYGTLVAIPKPPVGQIASWGQFVAAVAALSAPTA